MLFCEQVRHARKKLELTQTDLANALHVSFATVNRWENQKSIPSQLAMNTFYEFCENNFIDFDSISEK
jgi:DNA-binding transcriptional regulator YiaG